jgi:hypothetical protein
MPPQERRRRDHEQRLPRDARQHTTRGRQECPICSRERRPADPAAQDGQLMAKHHDLQFLELTRAESKDDELQNALKHDVADRTEHDASLEKSESAAILRKPN